MCGICGRLHKSSDHSVTREQIEKMCNAMVHRGPDDAGYFVENHIGLGHRRLSIIDLSTGHQPLSNEDATVWVAFNGEIYNYQEIKKKLISKGHIFKTNTDTEVIVHCYEQYGVDSIREFRGMFAFALWDSRKRTLLIARDRVGIKPLYYTITKDALLFASEIKCLLTQPDVTKQPNELGQLRYLLFNYTPGNETVFKDIYKLMPGHYLIYANNDVTIKKYWDVSYSEKINKYQCDKECAALDAELQESARLHMISDVPVGFLLSGGVDSTALLSYAVNQTDKKISTFTIGFQDKHFADERYYARLAAERFGTEHYESTITWQQFADFLPAYIRHMEEPVCEPPAIALYYITKMAQKHAKVLISGEGGDEAFGGYQNYRTELMLGMLQSHVGPLLKVLLSVLRNVGGHAGMKFEKLYSMANTPFDQRYLSRTSGPDSFFAQNLQHLFDGQYSGSENFEKIIVPLTNLFAATGRLNKLDKMLYIDTKTWLPDDLLIKADKMTMANSVELRVPLLDHKVLEYAARLPEKAKVNGFRTKYILKRTFRKRVPEEILKRKKTGFPVPYSSWLKNEMSEMVYDLLLSKKALQRKVLPKSIVENILDSHKKTGSYGKEVFMLAIMELWYQEFFETK